MAHTETPPRGNEQESTTGLLGGLVWPIIGLIILIFLLMAGCNSCQRKKEEKRAERMAYTVAKAQAEAQAEQEAGPAMVTYTKWFDEQVNSEYTMYMSSKPKPWRVYPKGDGSGVAVMAIVNQNGKVIVLDKAGINTPCKRIADQCLTFRPALPHELKPGEVPAIGVEITCYTCSLDCTPH